MAKSGSSSHAGSLRVPLVTLVILGFAILIVPMYSDFLAKKQGGGDAAVKIDTLEKTLEKIKNDPAPIHPLDEDKDGVVEPHEVDADFFRRHWVGLSAGGVVVAATVLFLVYRLNKLESRDSMWNKPLGYADGIDWNGIGKNMSAANWGNTMGKQALEGMAHMQYGSQRNVPLDSNWNNPMGKQALQGMEKQLFTQDADRKLMGRNSAAAVFEAADQAGDGNGKLSLDEIKAYCETDEVAKEVLGAHISKDFRTDDRPEMTKQQFQDYYVSKM